MSPAQKFFPAYFRPRNQYEIASGLCSVLIVLCALIGHMAFQLFPQGILAILSRSVRCVVLALCAAIFPITFFFVHSFIVTILYFISFGKIVLA